MSSRIERSGSVEFTNQQGTQSVNNNPQENEASIFIEEQKEEAQKTYSDKDKKIKRTVDNEDGREIRVGRDADGNKFRYTDDTKEELVTVTTTGKNTYMTKAEFDRQVKEMLHVDRLPEGIRAEFRNGNIIFINNETNETMSASDIRNNSEIAHLQKQKEMNDYIAEHQDEWMKQSRESFSKAILQETITIKPEELDKLKETLSQATIEAKENDINDYMKNKPAEMTQLLMNADIDSLKTAYNTDPRIKQFMQENINDTLPLLVQILPEKEVVALIGKNFKINSKSNVSAKDINKMLGNSPLKGLGQTFKDAEKKYNINALFLLGLTGIESSYGRNPATNSIENPGQNTKYNVVGMRADKTHHREYPSFEACIMDAARLLNAKYTHGRKIYTPQQIAKIYNGSTPDNIRRWGNFTASTIYKGTKNYDNSTGNLYAMNTQKPAAPKARPKIKTDTKPETEEFPNMLKEVIVIGNKNKLVTKGEDTNPNKLNTKS